MKQLISKTKIAVALMIVFITTPLQAWCGALILGNNTHDMAQYIVMKGQQVIARVPGIAPGQIMKVPTDSTYMVTAATVINGNTYTSAPIEVSGPTSFLAQVVQVQAHGSYEFNVVTMPVSRPNVLQFQKTTLSPVVFTISKDGQPLQNVVVNNSFEIQTLDIGDAFHIYAVVNGITTDVLSTENPNAAITVIQDDSSLASGFFTLIEQ